MIRVILFVLLLGPLARSADRVIEQVLRAMRLESQLAPGEARDLPLDRAYIAYGKIAMQHPDRFEPLWAMGLNRCMKAYVVRGMAASYIDVMRARGASMKLVQQQQANTRRFLDECIKDALKGFAQMQQVMVKYKDVDAKQQEEYIRFANASIKFARAEHLEAKRGAPGAIEDLQWLLKRRFRPELCARMIAEAYTELGAIEFADEKYDEAQALWDKALRFAVDPHVRQRIITNKAGSFEMDNEFGLAEDILKKQLEKEGHVPKHWKNLGLLLGYQARYREALYAYRKCRELCRKASRRFFLGVLHGNAWLRAALIHGKLLEDDGDIHTAWRLLMEYRRLFGDNYNFSLAMGEFALHTRNYDVAYAFIRHARDLQPFCPMPYSMLLSIAGRTGGTPEVVKQRVEEAEKAFRAARERFKAREENATLKRLCGGLRDVEDGAPMPGPKVMRLNPDPLAGMTADELPEWLVPIAKRRDPFRPFDPKKDAVKDRVAMPGVDEAATEEPDETPASRTWILTAAGAVVAAGVLFFLLRR